MSGLERLSDQHGRNITYIRLSLTDRCNFRCVYCMPAQGEHFIPHEEIVTYEELLRFCRLTAKLGITNYKVTGGEPLCRKGAVDFIRELKSTPGVEQVTLTTNGVLLPKYARTLAALGIDGINVSLDTLDRGRYNEITRSSADLDAVLAAMAEARALGVKIKINAVPLQDVNRTDLPELTRFALDNGYHIRFIELMPVGEGRVYKRVPQERIMQMLTDAFGALEPVAARIGNGPAEYYAVPGYAHSIGFISAVSKKFCSQCNRIRLTSLGFLKTCLHHNIGVDLKPLLRGKVADDEIVAAIRRAVAQKPLAHEFNRGAAHGAPENFFMNSVGG